MGYPALTLSGKDIVKVRLQTTSSYNGAVDCVKQVLIKEGPLAFYKGTLTPLIGIGACVSVQFGAFNDARRRFVAYNAEKFPLRKDLTYGQYYMAGAYAGIANSVLSSPIEHIRIRLQAQPHGAARYYNGPLDCVKKLMKVDGLRGGIYRGFGVTVLREAQAYGFWFLTFEYLMNQEKVRAEVPKWKIALYGGLAGEALWLASYPFDVIKSKLQTDKLGDEKLYKNARDCAKITFEREGLRGFWKGIVPTLVRAMPVSAGTFLV